MATTPHTALAQDIRPGQALTVRRKFTSPGVHPFDTVEWELRDARIGHGDKVAFEQTGVEFPRSWSQNATNIVAQKYFRGQLGAPERERSVKQMISRVAGTIADWGRARGYFATPEDGDTFEAELTHVLLHQMVAFNSPVWFNVGFEESPQASACFILSVEDNMESILDWNTKEGTIFRGGSGSGINLSNIRGSMEPLAKGGTASGPVSFMRGADSWAGTIKCLAAGTEVMTEQGAQAIEKIDAGDRVLTRYGLRTVTAAHGNGTKPLVKVTTELGDEILCSAEHRFLVRNSEGDELWREAGAIEPEDHLILDLGAVDFGELQPLATVAREHHNERDIVLPQILHEEFGRWLGWVYGDGNVTRRPGAAYVGIQIADSDPDLMPEYRRLTATVFGADAHLYVHARRDKADASCSVRIASTQLVRFLDVNDLAKSRLSKGELSVPSKIKSSPAEVRAAFLSGLFEADGSVVSGYPTLATVSHTLALDTHRLLLSIGIPSKLRRVDDRTGAFGTKPLYTVRVVSLAGIARFEQFVGFISARKRQALADAVARKSRCVYETDWALPHATTELNELWEGGGPQLKRALAPYCRYARPRALSGLRATALLNEHLELGGTVVERAASPYTYYTRAEVAPAGVGPVFDITVHDAHEYLVHNVVTHNSGGKTRRAAKMVVLDVDHPDIREFIWCKAREEEKAEALARAGFDMSIDGAGFQSIQYQNANNSVRVTDEFMHAVENDEQWRTIARTTGQPIGDPIPARELMREIAEAAWRCADPGVQYDTTINQWHTSPNSGRINASNPCSEYMHVDDSACNLASLNLMKFRRPDGTFDVDAFEHTVDIIFLAQEIIVGPSSYPTEAIGVNARAFRQLGLGYANLGAFLMANGTPYDSDSGRATAAAITALMTGRAYRESAKVAAALGPYERYHENREPHNAVMRMHRDASYAIPDGAMPDTALLEAARASWEEAVAVGEVHGYRNAQATVLAPTGCLVADSLVSTSRGLVRLRSLGDTEGEKWQELDLEVATDQGPRRTTQFYVNGMEQVVSVDTARGYRIQGTPTHRIKVVDEHGNWVWKRMAELAAGDRVPMMLNSLVGEPQEVALPPLGDLHWNSEQATRVPRRMSPELAEFVGYFMGDGSLHAKGLRLCVTDGDDDVLARLIDLGRELFGLEGHVLPREGYTELSFHSVALTIWWDACGFAKLTPFVGHSGKGWSPHVPDAILHSNAREVYAAFVRGLFEADGNANDGYAYWSTTNEDFSRDVQTLLLVLGFVTTRGVDGSRDKFGAPCHRLRLLNASSGARFVEDVGFISERKNAGLADADHPQAARHDHIPVSRALVDELAPANDQLRKAMLLQLSRTAGVSRRSATALLERAPSPELEHLLGYFYDTVADTALLDDQPTFDLSVPDNVTYVANGFVSHNTISFLMDCDTTGIEPDFSLVKFKELVGGGQMTIVNRTIPMALGTLGYSDEQIEAIEAYVNEHATIVGAPGLAAEHLPVFDVAVGERAISHMGHIKMMGAAQPFLSGAISKTVNMPQTATVEDIAEAYLEAWRCGVKALAIYRDGSKTAQALRTEAQKAVEADEVTVPDGWLSPEAVDAKVRAAVTTAKAEVGPARKRMPRERQSITHKFSIGGHEGYITAGMYEDGSIGEIFLTDIGKEGSTLRGMMNSFATSISIALQYGVPLETLVQKFSYMRFDPEGITLNPEIPFAKSMPDYIMRWLASRFLDTDTQEELGILTPEVRARMMAQDTALSMGSDTAGPSNGGGNGHGGNAASAGTTEAPAAVSADAPPTDAPAAAPTDAPAQPPAAAFTDTPPVVPAKIRGLDLGPACNQCGGMMQRTGSCYTCSSCGNNTGCG